MGLVLEESCSYGHFRTSLLHYRLEEKEYITRADEETVPQSVRLLSFSPSCCLSSGLQHFSPRLSELPRQTLFTSDENILSYKKMQRKTKHAYHHNLTNILYSIIMYIHIVYGGLPRWCR